VKVRLVLDGTGDGLIVTGKARRNKGEKGVLERSFWVSEFLELGPWMYIVILHCGV
jgi:hypothetical protein